MLIDNMRNPGGRKRESRAWEREEGSLLLHSLGLMRQPPVPRFNMPQQRSNLVRGGAEVLAGRLALAKTPQRDPTEPAYEVQQIDRKIDRTIQGKCVTWRKGFCRLVLCHKI